jgi:hypothetical protein
VVRIAYAALILRGRPEQRRRRSRRLAAWRGQWTVGDRVAVGLVVAGVALLVLAPVLTAHGVESMVDALMLELHPLP